MIVRLSTAQQIRLLDWSEAIGRGHVAAGCEPPGYELVITVAEPYMTTARAESGSDRIELGDVDIELDPTAVGA